MNDENQMNIRRRNLLKFLAFGGAMFLFGKFLSPLINTFQGDRVIDEKSFNNFTITETGRQLKIRDKSDNDLLVFEKDSF